MYALFAIGGICMFVIFGVLYYLSETLESEFALKGVLKGLVLAIPLAALCLSSFLAGKWIGKNKTRMKWLGFAGLALLTVSLGVIGLFDNIYVVVGLFTLGSAGIGATLPCLDALITEGVDKKQRGTITALFSSMRFIGVSLGPPVVSLLIGSHHFLLLVCSPRLAPWADCSPYLQLSRIREINLLQEASRNRMKHLWM